MDSTNNPMIKPTKFLIPDGVIGLMQQCWHQEASCRPSAHDAVMKLSDIVYKMYKNDGNIEEGDAWLQFMEKSDELEEEDTQRSTLSSFKDLITTSVFNRSSTGKHNDSNSPASSNEQAINIPPSPPPHSTISAITDNNDNNTKNSNNKD